MAYERIKTEHAGAKNRGGAWMTRAEAKQTANHQRRQADQDEAQRGAEDEPEMAELPESWQRFPSGEPVPNWVAALAEARRGRQMASGIAEASDTIQAMTAKEKLLQQAPQWNDAQATAALRVVEAHHELASYLDEEAPSTEDRWATANAREAIREERW